ncbi:hypothetical protein N8Z47_04480 [Salibacteraceae bacterium]|nr:hypothetical protein [Salibacteraceae bacterium]
MHFIKLFRVCFSLVILCLFFNQGYSQCTVYDGQGNNSANPVWVSCSGGTYTLYIQSPNNFGALTINWGDGSANTTVASLISPAFISHTYAAVITNYTVTTSKLITDSGGAHEVSLKWEIASERQKRKRRRSKFLIPCAKF